MNFAEKLFGVNIAIGITAALACTAKAEPRTLEELMADEKAGVSEIMQAKQRRRDLEEECDCDIVNGVKIHSYPGTWSARNRRLRDEGIGVYIEGGETPSIDINPSERN